MNNNKKYKCNFCDKIFSSPQSKYIHTKAKHSKEKEEEYKINEELINSNFKCKFCKNCYSTNGSLKRHLETACQEKDKIINNNANNLSNDMSKNSINGNNNVINKQNNITTININPVSNPKIDFTLLDICNIFDEQFNAVIKLIETTYFNPKLEENHCFYVSNLNGNHVNTYENQGEVTQLKKYYFDQLFGIVLDSLKSLYKIYKKKLFEEPAQKEIKNKIKALEEARNNNTNTYKSYMKLINILAYNNKSIVTKTWNKVTKPEENNNEDIIWDLNI